MKKQVSINWVVAILAVFIFCVPGLSMADDEGIQPVAKAKFTLEPGDELTFNMKDYSGMKIRAKNEGDNRAVASEWEFWGTASDNKTFELKETLKTLIDTKYDIANSWEWKDCVDSACAKVRIKAKSGRVWIKVLEVTAK